LDQAFTFQSYGARTASVSQKRRDINREKVNNKEGNKHEKNSEHQHIIPSDGRPEAEVNEFLP
jgi:hypothetical protein